MENQRTIQQNKSIHVYCRLLAEAMMLAGYDMRTTIKVPIRPTEQNVKDEMLKPVMKALFPDKESTTQLTKEEVNILYEQMNLFTAEKLGISVEFPSNEPPMLGS